MSFNNFFGLSADYASVILSLLICVVAILLRRKNTSKHPPGPIGVPLLGVIPYIRCFPEKVMEKWKKTYGPLFMCKVGTVNVAVIGSRDIAHEAFAKNDCFNDRPQSIPVFNNRGMFLLNFTDLYKEQRRFGLNTLREFGMGRRSLEPKLVETAIELCNSIDVLCGKTGESQPFEIHQMIYENISTVISYIIFSKDLVKENAELKDLIEFVMTPRKENYLAGLIMFAPFLRYLPFFSKVWNDGDRFREKMHVIIRKEIAHHEKEPCFDNPRDFIDSFLKEAELSEKEICEDLDNNNCSEHKSSLLDNSSQSNSQGSWKVRSSFTTDQLVATVRDFYLAGIDTTSSVISWIILFLSQYPDVQTKLQNELNSVLGQSGILRMTSLEKLPYLRSVVREVTRLRPPVPLGVPHLASRDSNLMGYEIPKGTIILTNIWAIHHDETKWPNPEAFLPERHFDSDGKFIKTPDWMIFNVGGRNCPGQQLAKMEIFILTATLFRRYTFSFPSDEVVDLNGESAVTLRPLQYKIVVKQN